MPYSEEFLRKIINNFPTYLAYVYNEIGLPNPTQLQNRIATILNENKERLILEAARGVGKSWIIAIYATWRLLRNVDEKVLIVSASGPKANEIASFVRSLFDNVPLLHSLKPTKGQRDAVLSFDVAGAKISISPSVSSIGITGQITGKRASLIIADDVEIPSNSMTEMMREKLINRVKEFEALLIPDMPSSIVFAGTPQSMESIYNKLDYETIILPAQVPEDESVYEGKLDDWILTRGEAGSPTDPERFPLETLLIKRAGMGESGYKLQFMLDTTLTDAERFPLKTRDAMIIPVTREEAPATISYSNSHSFARKDITNFGFTGDHFKTPFKTSDVYKEYDTVIMSIDPSGSGADETAFAIIGVLNGNVYVLDFGGTRKGYSDEALMFLAKKARQWDVNLIVPEKNFGSGMFTELFRKVLIPIHNCTIIDDFNVSGQKEKRIIDTIAPLLTNHQLVFNEDSVLAEAEWILEEPQNRLVYGLMYQLTHITYDKGSLEHDDRLDALAIALKYVEDMVGVDDKKLLEEYERHEMEKWVEEHIYTPYNLSKKPNILGNYQTLKLA